MIRTKPVLKIRSPTCQILSRHRSLDHRLHHLSRLAVFYFSVVYLCPWIAPVWLLVWLIPRRLSIIISQGLFWFVDNDRTWGSSRYSVLCSYKNTHYQSSLLTFLTICVSKWEGLKLTISCPEHLAQKCHRSNVQVIFPGCGHHLTPLPTCVTKISCSRLVLCGRFRGMTRYVIQHVKCHTQTIKANTKKEFFVR